MEGDRSEVGPTVIVVPVPGEEHAVTVVRGPREPLKPGPGFAVYEARTEAGRGRIEEFVTVICGPEPTLYAVSDEQFKSWKGRRFIARPVALERRG